MLTSTDQAQIPPLDTVVRERRASKTRYSLYEREKSSNEQIFACVCFPSTEWNHIIHIRDGE